MKLHSLLLGAGLLVALTVGAHARPASAKSGDGVSTGFVPVEQGERILTFSNEYHFFASDGRIYICPPSARSDENKCFDKEDKNRTSKWQPLDDYKIPGYERSGVSIIYAGMYAWRQLIVYYRKVSA